jgi:hypothetical protein
VQDQRIRSLRTRLAALRERTEASRRLLDDIERDGYAEAWRRFEEIRRDSEAVVADLDELNRLVGV